MDEETSLRVYRDPLARWFVTEAYRIAAAYGGADRRDGRTHRRGRPAALSPRLLPAHAAPGVFRQGLFLAARSWRRVGLGAARPSIWCRLPRQPLPAVYEHRKIFRFRLEGTGPQAPVLRQLQVEGATDYVALPLFFANGHVDALSLVSDRPGGFTQEDLDRLYHLHFIFTRVLENHSLGDTAANLLDASNT